MKIPKIIRIIISLVIFLILIKIVGIKKIIEIISNINLLYLIPIIIIYFITFLIGTWNINILLKAVGEKIRTAKLLKYIIISWSIGLLSPGKIGDFSIIYFLKKENIKMGKSFAVVFLDKVITLIVLLLFSIITTILLLTKKELIMVLLIAFIILLLIIILLTESVRNFIKKKLLGKYVHKFKGFYKTIKLITKNHKKEITYNFAITVLKWIISSINVLLIFMALGYYGNLIIITLISASLTIFNLIPITFHGIGLKEAGGIYLYGLIGIKPEIVVATYLIFNILAYTSAAIAIYLLTEEINEINKNVQKNT